MAGKEVVVGSKLAASFLFLFFTFFFLLLPFFISFHHALKSTSSDGKNYYSPTIGMRLSKRFLGQQRIALCETVVSLLHMRSRWCIYWLKQIVFLGIVFCRKIHFVSSCLLISTKIDRKFVEIDVYVSVISDVYFISRSLLLLDEKRKFRITAGKFLAI